MLTTLLFILTRGNCLPWINAHPFVFDSIHGLAVGIFPARFPWRIQRLFTGIGFSRYLSRRLGAPRAASNSLAAMLLAR